MQPTARNSTSYCDFQNRASPNRGDIINWTHPAGFTITNQIDDNQRISEIDSSLNDSTHPGMLAHMTYKPWGALATLLNGCAGTGCVQTQETYDYNNRLQLVRIQLGTATNASANYCLVYNYYAGAANPTTCTASPTQAATGNNGNVMGYLYLDPVNTTLQHSVAYTFDAVNRLASATAKDLSSNTLWTQSYIFTTDSSNGQYGNMSCTVGGSGYCPQVSYDAATNRISSIGSTQVSYDAAGDMTNDGTCSYQYDAERRVISSTCPTQWQQPLYNAFGQRVQDYQGTATDTLTLSYPVDIFGRRTGAFAQWPSQNWTGWNVYWMNAAGQHVSMGGTDSWLAHEDAIGTTTQVTDETGAVVFDSEYYPWGQVWQWGGPRPWSVFAGLHFPVNDPLDPATFREYNPRLGRWMTPDPLGGDVTNPQSLNRYAYALNNPATFNDPLGLCSDYDYSYTNQQGNYVIHEDSGPCPPDGLGLNELCLYSGYGCGYNAYNGSPYPYSGGGGYGGGGSSSASKPAPAGGPLPSYWQVLKSFNNCAANFADKYSVASLLHVDNVPVLNWFLGSSTAATSHLLFGTDPKEYVPGGLNALSTRGDLVLERSAASASSIPVDKGFQSLFTTIPPTKFGETIEGNSLLNGAKSIADFLHDALPWQILGDELAYGYGEAACTAQALGGW